MLAEPEYFSLPDEVCCWQGRRSGAASRGAVAELLAGSNAAECHREDVAGLGAAAKLQTSLGTAAESHREDAADRRCGRAADRLGRSSKVAGRGAAMAKMLLAGAPWRSCWQGHHGRVGGAGEE